MNLDSRDVSWIVKRLPKEIRTILEENNCCIAGGFIRSIIAKEDIQDIDIFVPSKAEATRIANLICTKENQYWSDNAISINKSVTEMYPIQIIHRWTFDSPVMVVPSFDFTIAKAAIWYDKENKSWSSACAETFYSDLAAKRLVYCSPERNEDAGGSMLRVLKFYQRGYRIALDSLGAVIARLNKGINWDAGPEHKEPDFEDWNAKIVTGLLREVDPNIQVPITEERT